MNAMSAIASADTNGRSAGYTCNPSTPLGRRVCVLGLAIALTLGAAPTFAQVVDHSMHMPPAKPASAAKKPVPKKPVAKPAARIELEYDTLLTNRLILQSLIEAEVYGKDDARRGIGSGLSKMEGGLRLRYEVTRRFAPYIGGVHERVFGGTADLRRDDGERANDTRIVAGLRFWF